MEDTRPGPKKDGCRERTPSQGVHGLRTLSGGKDASKADLGRGSRTSLHPSPPPLSVTAPPPSPLLVTHHFSRHWKGHFPPQVAGDLSHLHMHILTPATPPNSSIPLLP